MGETWAVLVNWNGGTANVGCIRGLLEQGLVQERIVFVDNASSDGSLQAVQAKFQGLHVLLNSSNLGYGAGTNRGIELALEHGARAVLLVNNDLVLAPKALGVLFQELMGDEGLGIVGPRVLYAAEHDRIWAAGGRMTWRKNLSELIGHRRPDAARYQVDVDVDYVPGCAMLVRREVFERIGLLEVDYFAYHEDVEFCLLAREAGWCVRLIGQQAAYHDAHHSTGGGYNPRRKYLMGVNTVWFLRRHGSPWRWFSVFVHDVLSLPFVWLLRAPRGEGAAVRAKARGLWDGLRGRKARL